MTAPRTVTVSTSDHGPVTAPEPRWCTGAHDTHSFRADIIHVSRPFTVRAGRPRADFELLSVTLVCCPFSERPGGRAPYLNVVLAEAETWEADLPEVLAFAARLALAAPRVAWAGTRARLLRLGGGR